MADLLFCESVIQYIHFMQNVATQLRAFMERNRLSQQQLARSAKVSQATVCRALQGRTIRGAAKARLFSYAQLEADPSSDKTRVAQRLIAAFDRIWDRSEMHADALVRIIDTLADIPAETASVKRRASGKRRNQAKVIAP